MKKNYLKWLTMMVVAIVSVSLVSCGDDDDDPISGPGSGYVSGGGSSNNGNSSNPELLNQLQGTWKFQKGTEKMTGGPGVDLEVEITRSMLSSLKASLEQQMGRRVEFWDETLKFNGNKLNDVNFTLNGNNINIEGFENTKDLTVSVSVKSVTASTLVLHEEFKIKAEGMETAIIAEMEYSKQ